MALLQQLGEFLTVINVDPVPLATVRFFQVEEEVETNSHVWWCLNQPLAVHVVSGWVWVARVVDDGVGAVAVQVYGIAAVVGRVYKMNTKYINILETAAAAAIGLV